jgi:hypothetical protein
MALQRSMPTFLTALQKICGQTHGFQNYCSLKKRNALIKPFTFPYFSSSFLSLEESESIIHYPKNTKLFPKTYITSNAI